MTITDDSFFQENIVKINKRINLVLFCAELVPLSFIILTYLGVWYVPTAYSMIIFVYVTISSIICFFLNKSSNKNIHIASMYIGLIGVSIFVFLLGIKGVIVLTVSYAFASVLSCLYYNRRLTFIITTVNFFLSILAFWMRSSGVSLVVSGLKTPERWFIENVPGIIVEFIFVYIITDSLARRTSTTLRRLVSMNEDINGAYRRLNEKNLNQFNANKELQEKNDFITKLNNELNSMNQALQTNQKKIIEFVAKCLGSHDLFTGQHIIHTCKYVKEICRELKKEGHYVEELDDDTIERYTLAAFLHDIGKIHIPEGVLNKIGKFTPEEFELMKCHPMEGRKLLEYLPPIDDGKFNVNAKEMALYHHEKWDGSGYPYGLSGDTIPLCARIMAAADVLDALISQRLYKEPMSVDEAMEVFEKAKGTQFDPVIADAVIRLKPLIALIDSDFKANEATQNATELAWWQRYHANVKNPDLEGK